MLHASVSSDNEESKFMILEMLAEFAFPKQAVESLASSFHQVARTLNVHVHKMPW